MQRPTRLLTGSVAVCGLAIAALVGAPITSSADAPTLMASVTLPADPTLESTLGALVTPATGAPAGVTYTTTWSADGTTVLESPGLPLGLRYFGSSVSATVVATAPDGATQSLTSAPIGPLTRFADDSLLRSTSSAVSLDSTWSTRSGTYGALAGQVSVTQSWLRDGAAIDDSAASSHTFVAADRGHRLTHRIRVVQAGTGLDVHRDTGPTPVVGSVTGRIVIKASPYVRVGAGLDQFVTSLSPYPPASEASPLTTTTSWTRDGRVVPWPTNYGKNIGPHEAGSVVGVRLTVSGRLMTTTSLDATLPRVPGRPYLNGPSMNPFRAVYRVLSNGWVQEMRVDQSATGPYLWNRTFASGWGGMTLVASGGDLTNDGAMDLVARDSTGTLWSYSAGWVQTGARFKMGTGWNGMNLLVLGGDYDGDRFGDLLARRSSDGALLLYRGTGTGTLRAGTVLTTGFRNARTIVSVGDANGDGRSDLHAVWANGDLYFYAGRGNGTFAPGVRVGTGWQGMTRVLNGGDINADGKPDLYALDASNRLWVYRGTGTGSFGARFELKSSGGAMSRSIF
ncbi:VCBS repeat-containing protein [Intrasporangium sp. YIM S08009]|uniref:FG-GAP repeat domain-containing protein n=1 Tax=Intrasporangium zincisolvens TaxID=3080018 RepID=UPI002B055381|nr:VCBS repeat-containing protein [Intrasporangium sp. YIM S08009]